MKVVLVLISVVLGHLALADNSKSLVKDSSDSQYGKSIVKPLERSVREGRKGKNRNNKPKGRRNLKQKTKGNKNQKAPLENRASKKASRIKKKRTQQRRIKKKLQNKIKNKQNKRKARKQKTKGKNKKKQGKSTKRNNKKYKRRNNKNSSRSKNKNDNRKSKQMSNEFTKKTKSHKRSKKNIRKKSKKKRKNTEKNKKNKKGTVKEKNIKQSGNKFVRQGNTCSFKDIVGYNRNYIKNINTLAQLKRIVRNLKRLASKSQTAMTTFTNASAAISAATSDGTTCNCDSTSAPEEAIVANTQLKNCSTTAPTACSNSSIVYNKTWTNCTGCNGTCSNASTCTPATCTSCPNTTYTLTRAMVAHINDTCIPELEKWTKRYKACSNKKPKTPCSTYCHSPPACDPSTSPDKCTYDTCLADANNDTAILDCQCPCYKTLNSSKYQISTTKVGGLNCYGIAKFERKTKERRDGCQLPTADNLSGNFGDCRYQERQTPFYINKCVGPYVCTSTTKATFRRNRFLAELQMLKLQNKWRK